MAPHQILIGGVVLILLGSVATHIEWRNIPKIGAAVGQFFPHGGGASATVRGETAEARRDRLREMALNAGQQAEAQPCDLAIRQNFKNALIDLARQRMRDMGCTVDYACNVENGFKEVSFKYYSTEKDRQVSEEVTRVAKAGGIAAGEIGIYQYFVGHPEALPGMMSTMPTLLEPGCSGVTTEN
jgi:hypothetical protein